jgi:hypothetical protein
VGEQAVFLGDEGAFQDMRWRPRSFSLFERRLGAKRELAGLILAQEASSKRWDGGTINSTAANFAKALRQ